MPLLVPVVAPSTLARFPIPPLEGDDAEYERYEAGLATLPLTEVTPTPLPPGVNYMFITSL